MSGNRTVVDLIKQESKNNKEHREYFNRELEYMKRDMKHGFEKVHAEICAIKASVVSESNERSKLALKVKIRFALLGATLGGGSASIINIFRNLGG